MEVHLLHRHLVDVGLDRGRAARTACWHAPDHALRAGRRRRSSQDVRQAAVMGDARFRVCACRPPGRRTARAPMPERVTRLTVSSQPAGSERSQRGAKPSMRTPRSMSAPSTMSPEAPEKQSKYRILSMPSPRHRACRTRRPAQLSDLAHADESRRRSGRGDRARRCPSTLRRPRAACVSARSSTLGVGSPDG